MEEEGGREERGREAVSRPPLVLWRWLGASGHALFLVFLRSRGGSLSALTTSDDADGMTLTVATRFWMVSATVTRRPFQSAVDLAMSSPTFLGFWWETETAGERRGGRGQRA